MLTKEQVEEIKSHLEKAQNPLFFFDNDADGLCSFLILQRYIGRGKGVAIKTFPDMAVDYFRKVKELESDYIFILDKPCVSDEFFDKVAQYNIPVVWIDHHIIQEKIPDFVNYYNSLGGSTTVLCYQISERKEDLWFAVVGSVADRHLPEFYEEFRKKYPELSVDANDAYDVRYKSQIGAVVRILEFALKDKTTNVVHMLKFLMKAKSPYDILEENKQNYSIHKRFKELNNKYQNVLDKAMRVGNSLESILFFRYGGETKFTQNLSDELMYRFPEKIIVVAFVDFANATISIRGEKIREKIMKVIEDFDDATCGGHENSVGAKIKSEDLEKFEEKVREAFV